VSRSGPFAQGWSSRSVVTLSRFSDGDSRWITPRELVTMRVCRAREDRARPEGSAADSETAWGVGYRMNASRTTRSTSSTPPLGGVPSRRLLPTDPLAGLRAMAEALEDGVAASAIKSRSESGGGSARRHGRRPVRDRLAAGRGAEFTAGPGQPGRPGFGPASRHSNRWPACRGFGSSVEPTRWPKW